MTETRILDTLAVTTMHPQHRLVDVPQAHDLVFPHNITACKTTSLSLLPQTGGSSGTRRAIAEEPLKRRTPGACRANNKKLADVAYRGEEGLDIGTVHTTYSMADLSDRQGPTTNPRLGPDRPFAEQHHGLVQTMCDPEMTLF